MKKLVCIIGLGVLPLSSFADVSNIQEWMQESSKDLKGKVQKLPDVKPYIPKIFDLETTTKSPFDSAKIEPDYKKGAVGGPDFEAREKRGNFLEKYSLESIQMIGTLLLKGKMLGIVQVDGKIQQIKAGDYIGLDFGIVQKVELDQIVVKETIEDINEGWLEKINILQLQKTNEESKK